MVLRGPKQFFLGSLKKSCRTKKKIEIRKGPRSYIQYFSFWFQSDIGEIETSYFSQLVFSNQQWEGQPYSGSCVFALWETDIRNITLLEPQAPHTERAAAFFTFRSGIPTYLKGQNDIRVL